MLGYLRLLAAWGLVQGLVFAQAPNENQILAKVNTEIITRRDVERELGQYLEALRQDELKSDEERALEYRQALLTKLRQMVYEELTRQLGQESGITVPEGYVERRVREEAEQVEGLPRLVEVLKEKGMTLDELRAAFETDYVVREVLLRQAGLRPDKGMELPPLDTYVGPAQVYEYYRTHQDEFRSESGIKASMIVLRGQRSTERREARRRAEEVHRQALAGVRFAQLAREHSDSSTAEDGGRLSGGEWKQRGEMRAELEEVIWSLPSGGISDIVETPTGYYIFRVDDRMEASLAPYAQVQAKIRSRLQNERLQENIQRIQKRLLEVAYVWPESLLARQ